MIIHVNQLFWFTESDGWFFYPTAHFYIYLDKNLYEIWLWSDSKMNLGLCILLQEICL